MTFATIPSVKVDAVAVDHANATQGASESQASDTFELADGQTLTLKVDGGAPETVTFYDVDFDVIALARAEEVVAAIVAQLTGATAEEAGGGKVRIVSGTWGSASSIQVTGGTANAILQFPTSVESGTAATGLVTMNRVPEPGEDGVPVGSTISMDLFSTTGSAPGAAAVEVWVNGTLAFSGGTFKSGFDGPASATALPDAATRRIVIDPTTDFDPDTDVEVEVEVSSPGHYDAYEFSTEDLVQPGVQSVLAVGVKSLQVTFTEPVKQVSATATDDALNPSNYSVTASPPEDMPAVSVEVLSVTTVSPTTVELATDIELTFGIRYLLTAQDVEDLAGNPLLAGISTDRPFFAFSPGFPEGRRFVLWDMLPQLNRQEDSTGDLRRWVSVLQEPTNVMLAETDAMAESIDPDFAALQFVEAMLYDMGNPFGFVDLSEVEKRRLVQLLLQIYKQKGTADGIVNVVRLLLGLTVTIEAFNTAASWTLGPPMTQARLITVNQEPFTLGDGENIKIRVDDDAVELAEFNASEFVDIANATAREVADVMDAEMDGVTVAAMPDGEVIVQRDDGGDGTSLQLAGGSMAGVLGFPSEIVRGTGTDDSGTSELGVDSYLAPGTSRQLYTFEVHSPVALTQEERDRVEEIVEYMKPAHTHLLRIVEPETDVEPEGIELGTSYLGGTPTDPGTWELL